MMLFFMMMSMMMMMMMMIVDDDYDDDDVHGDVHGDGDDKYIVKRYFRLVCEYDEDWMQISRALSGGVSADVSVCTVYVMIIIIHDDR